MKNLYTILLLINFSAMLISMDDKRELSVSRLLSISERISKSPESGSSLLANRSVPSEEEKAKLRQDYDDDALIKITTDFISTQAPLIIKEIILEKFNGNCSRGNLQIDSILADHLKNLKSTKIDPDSEPLVKRQPDEDLVTYRIRSNPVLSNEIDQQTYSLAILLNKILRFSHSK